MGQLERHSNNIMFAINVKSHFQKSKQTLIKTDISLQKVWTFGLKNQFTLWYQFLKLINFYKF